jgi:hypothetical protein
MECRLLNFSVKADDTVLRNVYILKQKLWVSRYRNLGGDELSRTLNLEFIY